MFPSIEASEVGNTGLLWLFLTYGFVLYKASGLISEGSELLLLVPSLAGLVGGVVLPLLGAVPDGAIMLFSGIGDIETVQESISVGVGALAGSTIMLLTIPLGLSIFAGRVNLVPSEKDGSLSAKYNSKPKLSEGQSLAESGIAVTDEIRKAATIMVITTLPFFLIQVPALFIHGSNEEMVHDEKKYALLALIICIVGFVWYLNVNVKASRADEDKFARTEKIKELLLAGTVSLSGALLNVVETFDHSSGSSNSEYQSIDVSAASTQTNEYLRSILKIPFQKYDKNSEDGLQKDEMAMFFRDFNENVSNYELDSLFVKYDIDGSGTISFDEFVAACHAIITASRKSSPSADEVRNFASASALEHDFSQYAMKVAMEDGEEEEEEEEIPHDIAHLPAEEQQSAIKKKAFTMLGFGTLLVLVFSDPMVEVMQEIAGRIHISPFYVSFALAPLAANASEVLASTYYASKKTTKTITVSFSALMGAAAMNNTFCLAIFMGIIYFRGLAWEFTAETIAIVSCQIFIYFMTKGQTLSALQGVLILSTFPFSIILVAFLENVIGLD